MARQAYVYQNPSPGNNSAKMVSLFLTKIGFTVTTLNNNNIPSTHDQLLAPLFVLEANSTAGATDFYWTDYMKSNYSSSAAYVFFSATTELMDKLKVQYKDFHNVSLCSKGEVGSVAQAVGKTLFATNQQAPANTPIPDNNEKKTQ